MAFLHDGRPPVVREAVWEQGAGCGVRGAGSGEQGAEPRKERLEGRVAAIEQELNELKVSLAKKSQNTQHSVLSTQYSDPKTEDHTRTLLAILSSLNVCSKEWIIRQYDHEVQGGSVIKPLVGVVNDGPSDAAVLRPVLSSRRGIVVACGMNPCYGDLDPYWMAAAAIDEAVRNCVAVGADPQRIAILDNFCWGNTDRPETLGSLVRAALACYDVATVLGTPFISGKDSLNNEFRPHGAAQPIAIPPSLLISALARSKTFPAA